MSVTPSDLFEYANTYARNAEAEGRGTKYPTVREAARHFHVSQSSIREVCDDWQGDGYMQLATAIRVGAAVGAIDIPGDHLIEAYL